MTAAESVFALIDEPPESDAGTGVDRARAGAHPLRPRDAALLGGGPARAVRSRSRDRPRRVRRARRAFGRRQDDARQSDPALLHAERRARAARRRGRRDDTARRPAAADCAREPGDRALQRHDRRQHRLRHDGRRDERGDRARGRGGERARLHPRATRAASTPSSASAASASRADSGSASRSRARSSRTRRS